MQSSLQSHRYVPDPSMKNGRRSWKNVSKAPRFTTAGSASTCPKSGLTVAVSDNAGVTAYFRSSPAERFGLKVFRNGLPSSPGCVTAVATVYGASSSRFDLPDGDTPSRFASCDMSPFLLRASSGHDEVSFRRGT